MDFSRLSAGDQAKMQQIIEQKQMKDFMQLYTNLVERCFKSCVNDFTSTTMTGKEDKCVERCIDKFIKHSERVGIRFAEQNVMQQQQQQQQMKQ